MEHSFSDPSHTRTHTLSLLCSFNYLSYEITLTTLIILLTLLTLLTPSPGKAPARLLPQAAKNPKTRDTYLKKLKQYKLNYFEYKHQNIRTSWSLNNEDFPPKDVIEAYTTPRADRSTESFSWGEPHASTQHSHSAAPNVRALRALSVRVIYTCVETERQRESER